MLNTNIMLVKFLLAVELISWSCNYIYSHEVIFERIESAFGDDDKVLSFEGLRVKKFNRTIYVVNGAYTLKMPLDDSLSVSLNLFNFQGGQYKKMGDRKLDHYCKSMYKNEIKSYFEKFQASTTNPTPWKACPFPPGRNEVNNYLLEENGLLPPYIPGGEKWKAEVRFLQNDIELGGYNFYAIIRSDEKLLG